MLLAIMLMVTGADFSMLTVQAATQTSGKWGDNATWTFDVDSNTLTISGTGELERQQTFTLNVVTDPIKKIVIEDGITGLGNQIFYTPASSSKGYKQVEEIILPESVTSIGSSAFENCTALKTVNIPNGVTRLQEGTFSGCEALESLTLPEHMSFISNYALGCKKLKTLILEQRRPPSLYSSNADNIFKTGSGEGPYIPETIIVPYGDAGVTPLEYSLQVYKQSRYWGENDPNPWSAYSDKFKEATEGRWGANLKWNYNTTSKTLTISGTGEMKEGSYDASDHDADIYPWVSYSSVIVHLVIEDGVTKLPGEVFNGFCFGKLEDAHIPDSVTEIGAGLFQYPVNSISIGAQRRLKTVRLSDNLTELGDSIFNGCAALETVNIPSRLTKIGDKVFHGCASLKELTIPQGVTEVGAYALACSGLEKLDVDAEEPPVLDEKVFYYEPSEKEDLNKHCKFFIPGGTKAAYSQANVWKDHKSRFTEKLKGGGTEEDPYQIGNRDDLEFFITYYRDGYGKLTQDIGSKDSGQWRNPIDTEESPFTGTLDGDGHTIYIYIKQTGESNKGLVAFNNGTIKNLTLEGELDARANVGAFAGVNMENGRILDCTSKVKVKTGNEMFYYVGVMVGENRNTAAGSVTGSYQSYENFSQGLKAIGNQDTDPKGITLYKEPIDLPGEGTEADPYQITSSSDLYKLYECVWKGNSFEEEYFQVMNDIDLNCTRSSTWKPIGTCYNDDKLPDKPFAGTFDGGGYTISTIYTYWEARENNKYRGLFGYNTGTIKNLTVSDGMLQGSQYIGTIAGRNDGSIINCISNVLVDAQKYAGGIAGWNNGIIDTCTQEDSVSGYMGQGDVIGGIVGVNGENGRLKNNHNYGNVWAGKEYTYVGAVIGRNDNANTDADAWPFSENYYKKAENTNPNLTGIGGVDIDPDGIYAEIEYKFEGSGTEDKPYIISKKEDLQGLKDSVNRGNSYEGKHFKVTADIDLGGASSPWTPIGTADHPFEGIIDGAIDGDGDGGCHTISGLYINNTEENQGLFGVNAGTIQNLTVTGDVTGKDNVGGIAGTNTGKIQNCTSNVTVNGENNVGGIAGKNDGTITACNNTKNVAGKDSVGGIAGNNGENGKVENSENNGSVTGSGTGTGGIAGKNDGTLTNDKNTAPVTGKDDVGGIAGTNGQNGTVEDCTGNGAVSGENNVGGIAGTNDGALQNDTNTASVKGKDNVGGIAGTNGQNGTVESCTNSGNVTKTGDGDGKAGAVIGNNQNENTEAVKDDYYQQTEEINSGLTGIGKGTGADAEQDPEGITSGKTPTKQEKVEITFEGAGTSADPYQIKDRDDFAELSYLVNHTGNSFEDSYFVIPEDIRTMQFPVDAGQPWEPIGTNDYPFKGTFDGNHTCVNMLYDVDTAEDNQGLFGVNAGKIIDVVVSGNVTGKDNVGSIAGINMAEGLIKFCATEANITGENYVGGLVGKNEGTVDQSFSRGNDVTGSGNYVGGLVGSNSGTMTVTGNSVGTVKGHDCVGGIAGNNTGKVEDTGNYQTVQGSGSGTGGIVGVNSGEVAAAHNYYYVTGKDDVGGIVGRNELGGTVKRCTNVRNGNVSMTEGGNGKLGAIIGNNLNMSPNLSPDVVDDDYYQTTEWINKGLTGIGGVTPNPSGITCGPGETSEDPNIPDDPKPSFEGAGTAEAPYLIRTEDDLKKLADLVNKGEDQSNAYYRIDAEGITLTDKNKPWTPIGTTAHPFTGTFDGNGKTINGLEINDNMKDNQGLFGVNAGTIENLTVAGNVTGKDNVGGIVGTNTSTGTIQNCTNNANVTGKNNVDGIAGKNDGTITGCQNNGTVTGKTPVDEVKEKIDAIGGVTPENAQSKKDLIEDAREAYDNLTDDQKKQIDSEEKKKLTEAEKAYDNATGGHNQAAADAVKEKIDAIPSPVQNNEDTKQKIEDAREAYDKLTETQKDMLPEESKKKLEESEDAYSKLITGEVEKKIAEIGEVTPENAADKKDLIEDARGAYDKLTDEQKEMVSEGSKNKLTEAEKLYDEATGGSNQKAADEAKEKIDAIPSPVQNDLDTKLKLEDALEAYDGLTGTQKDMVPEESRKKLEESENAYNKLVTDEVKKKIDAIGEVTPENARSKKDLIEDAREAYDSLTDGQKELISPSEKKKLTDAEKAYDDAAEKQNQAAADEVERKINAIPSPVQKNEDTKQKIEDAREAYDKLTETQKDMVRKESKKKLENAEDAYNKLAAEEVKQKIDAIGEVVTPGDAVGKQDLIEEAREAYDNLTDEQKELIDSSEKKKLTDAEKIYDDATEKRNQTAADEVKGKIDAIPDQIKNDEDTKQKIEEARDAFDNLTGTQKDMVSEESRKKLEDSEHAYNKLVTEEVRKKIDAIGEITVDNAADKKDLIEAAKDAYDKLTDDQKEMVPPSEKKKLTDAEKIYGDATDESKAAVREVIKKIDAIGEVTLDNAVDKRNFIEGARKAYDELSDTQKGQIDSAEKKKLTDAEKVYDDATGGTNQKAANIVKGKIDAIPVPVKADSDSKTKIEDAKKAYDELTSVQKDMLPEESRKKLEDAVKEYDNLLNAADNAAAQNVVNKINAIGTVAKTDACAAKIKDARTAYDALTDAQKKLVPAAVLKKLTDAEAAYAALTKTSNLPPEKQQQIDNIAEKLGVSKETAQKIQALADELGVSAETLLLTDNSFADSQSEDDIKGSTFSLLQLKVTKIAAKQVTLKWKKVKAADGYQIYGTRCGKGNKAKLIKTIEKNSKTSLKVKKLLKGKAYRYVVRAYKVIDGQKITIAASKTAHIFTNGGKYGNAKSVKVNKAKVKIKKGKKFKLKAKEVKANKPLRRHRKLCYESSNPDVATVTKKGVIKGKSKGTCTIYAYAQNGVFKKIKVTVK